MKRTPWLVLAFPVTAALVATALFFIQGGFGAGHGRFDRAIGVLGLPSILLLMATPLPPFVTSSDLFMVIWLPALGNCVAWALTAAAFRAAGRSFGAK